MSSWFASSLAAHEERLPFFGGKLRRVAAADVLHRVRYSGRDEQRVAGLEHHRRPALERVLQQAFDDVGDLFARMRVPGGGPSRRDLDERLNDIASGTLRSNCMRSVRLIACGRGDKLRRE
jgi:hypothetical protein